MHPLQSWRSTFTSALERTLGVISSTPVSTAGVFCMTPPPHRAVSAFGFSAPSGGAFTPPEVAHSVSGQFCVLSGFPICHTQIITLQLRLLFQVCACSNPACRVLPRDLSFSFLIGKVRIITE